MNLWKQIISLIFFIMTMGMADAIAQDLLVTTSGLKFKAKVIAVEKDSVKYVNKFDPNETVLTVPKSQLKYIEYFNGEFDFFEGSYQNLSPKDSTVFITGVEDGDRTLMIDAISFSVENYFTENHLVIDFSKAMDSNLIAVKGKIDFEFENLKYNFTIRSYKSDEKTIYTKFTKGFSASEKRYKKLSDKLLSKIRIYSGGAVITITLTPMHAEEMRELFRKTKID
jgi:hypothetical protein